MLSNALRTCARPLAAGALRSSLARQAAPAARLVHATRAAREDAPKAANPGELLFTLTDPASCIFEAAPVEMVILPGVDGQFGVMPNHVPTIAELKPGVVSVQEAAGGPLTKCEMSRDLSRDQPRSDDTSRDQPQLRRHLLPATSRRRLCR